MKTRRIPISKLIQSCNFRTKINKLEYEKVEYFICLFPTHSIRKQQFNMTWKRKFIIFLPLEFPGFVRPPKLITSLQEIIAATLSQEGNILSVKNNSNPTFLSRSSPTQLFQLHNETVLGICDGFNVPKRVSKSARCVIINDQANFVVIIRALPTDISFRVSSTRLRRHIEYIIVQRIFVGSYLTDITSP